MHTFLCGEENSKFAVFISYEQTTPWNCESMLKILLSRVVGTDKYWVVVCDLS